MNTTVEELPPDVMAIAFTLRNSVRKIYLTAFKIGREATAEEIAMQCGHARAYVNMRLNQLEDMGHVKSRQHGREKLYELVRKTQAVPTGETKSAS